MDDDRVSRGATSEDMFLKAFDSVPKLEIATQKKLENELARVVAIISNQSADWDARVQAIKHFRSLVNCSIANLDDFHQTTLKQLEIPFQNNICDLRSQVVRETCITIAFLSCRLQQKFSRMAEILLPSLIKLIPNSAKIISTSALVALRFIIQSTHNSRLIPILRYQLSTSKAKDIHRALCEIAERIVTLWPPAIIERHLNDFQEVLRMGICDPDEMARQYSRRAFNAFAEHFREPADRLFNSLDSQRQRMLNNLNHGGGSTLSMNSYGSAANSLNTFGNSHRDHHHQPHSINHNHHSSSTAASAHGTNSYGFNPNTTGTAGGSLNISFRNQSGTLVSRLKNTITSSSSSSSHTNGTASPNTSHLPSPSRIRTPTARSTSAIDVDAQKRARARAVYLSSMYTRPRQLNTIQPSPAKASANTPNHSTRDNASSLASSSGSSSNASTITSHSAIQPASSVSVTNHTLLPQSVTNSRGHQQISALNYNSMNHNRESPVPYNSNVEPELPNVAQQQKELQQLQQQQAASAEKKDGVAMSKAAAYLLSIISNSSIAESQIVTTIKYFNSLIDSHPPELVRKLLSELMPPFVIGIGHSAIAVRKASVFAVAAIHSKVGLQELEHHLTSLSMAQRKLLEVYFKKKSPV